MDFNAWIPKIEDETDDLVTVVMPADFDSPVQVLHAIQRLVDLGYRPIGPVGFGRVACYKPKGV